MKNEPHYHEDDGIDHSKCRRVQISIGDWNMLSLMSCRLHWMSRIHGGVVMNETLGLGGHAYRFTITEIDQK